MCFWSATLFSRQHVEAWHEAVSLGAFDAPEATSLTGVGFPSDNLFLHRLAPCGWQGSGFVVLGGVLQQTLFGPNQPERLRGLWRMIHEFYVREKVPNRLGELTFNMARGGLTALVPFGESLTGLLLNGFSLFPAEHFTMHEAIVQLTIVTLQTPESGKRCCGGTVHCTRMDSASMNSWRRSTTAILRGGFWCPNIRACERPNIAISHMDLPRQ